MTDSVSTLRSEIERMGRVSDQLCTAHAAMRDRFSSRQLASDIAVLLLAAWTSAMGFLDPRLLPWLTPPHLDGSLWIGLLGISTFALTLIQSKADWRGRREAHQRSFSIYAEVKREAGNLLTDISDIPARDFQRLADKYHMASEMGTGIPERSFLALKRRHTMKIAISKLLDEKPASAIWLTKLKLILRDNLK